MFILARETGFGAPLWPVLLAAMAVAAAMGLGLFRRRSIVGPVRLGDDEPVDGLTAAMIAGWLTWFLAPVVMYRLVSGHFPATAPTTAPTAAPAIEPGSILVDLLSRFLVIGVIVLVMTAVGMRLRRMGLAPGQLLPGIGRALAGILFVAPLMLLALAGTDQLWKLLHWDGTFVHDALRQLGSSPNWKLRTMLLASILVAAPVSEELFFRGCMQTLVVAWLSRFLPKGWTAAPRWGGVILTSLLFAWAHLWWSRPPIFVLSMCLGYAYERTGNLWTNVALHALFNAAEVILYFQLAT